MVRIEPSTGPAQGVQTKAKGGAENESAEVASMKRGVADARQRPADPRRNPLERRRPHHQQAKSEQQDRRGTSQHFGVEMENAGDRAQEQGGDGK